MANFDRANRDRDDYDRDGRDYDGGTEDDDNEGSHLPVVIIIAILVLAAFGGVVWLAYNQGVARGRSDGPVRIAATTKGDDSGIKVYQQSAGPEEDGTSKAAAPTQQAATQTPAQQAPAPQETPAPTQAATVPPPPPLMGPKTAQPAPKPQQQVAAAKPYTLPATDEPAKPQVATKPPAQLGGAHPAAVPPAAAKPVAPAPLKPATLKPVAETPAKAAVSGSYLLQIGAFKSDAEARTAWKAYQTKHATLLNGFGPDVQKVDLGDKGTWYRLRIASFPDKDAAAAVCERLKSQGGSCFLAK